MWPSLATEVAQIRRQMRSSAGARDAVGVHHAIQRLIAPSKNPNWFYHPGWPSALVFLVWMIVTMYFLGALGSKTRWSGLQRTE